MTFAGINVGRIRTAVSTDAVPADVVVAPIGDFKDFAPKLAAGSERPLGRILFGRGGQGGRCRIPTFPRNEKFVAFIKQAGVLAFANPKVGSLTGGMVEEMLKRPEFAGVERRPIKGMIGEAIARGDAPFGGGAITEEIDGQGCRGGGPVSRRSGPACRHIGGGAEGLRRAAEAEAFLRYVTRPEAGWRCGRPAASSETPMRNQHQIQGLVEGLLQLCPGAARVPGWPGI